CRVASMKIVVIHTGARSSVLRQTLNTREWEAYAGNATDITSALYALGHEAIRLTDGPSLVDSLIELRPDVAWICSGGIQGRDPATHLPGLLEMLGLDYVGSTPLPAGLADNKARAKVLLRDVGITTPDFSVVRAGTIPHSTVASDYPVVVKPVCGMCSCGVRRADNFTELQDAVAALQQRYRDDVLVERFVAGIDVTVSVLQEAGATLRCLPPVQRFFGGRDDPAFAHFALPHPQSQLREGPPVAADLTQFQHAAMSATAASAFAVLGLRHFARIDLRISDSAMWFLEANHKPDLTRTSLFALSAKLAGLDYHDLIRHILTTASQNPTGQGSG
ncbi:MAG: D-alanine--D-alanine ligase family protein, partial [Gammaproteobacteria bacterium]